MKIKRAKFDRQTKARGSRGIALILVMLSMLVLSVLAAGIVFTARSETLASHSFAVNTQADYLAKAGIQQAVNWLRSPHYVRDPASNVPGLSESQANTYYCVTSTGTPYNLLTANSEPVQLKGASCPNSGSPVQLIGYGSQTTNFPAINNEEGTPRAVTTAFATDLKNVRVTGDAGDSGTFSVNLYLLSYQTVDQGTTSLLPVPLETWLITSKATWTGSASSNTAVATAVEQATVHGVYLPNWGDAMYAYCSVQMQGSAGVCTDSFNSAMGQYDGGVVALAGKCNTTGTNVIDSGASIGANGYVTTSNKVTVDGNVIIGSDPSAGCPAGTTNIKGTVDGQVVNGPPKPVIPAPIFRSGFPGTAPNYTAGVLPSGASWPTMPPFPGAPTAPASNSPPVTNSSGNAIHTPCMDTTCDGTTAHPYEINSLSPSGTGQLVGGPDPFHPVVYDIASISESGTAAIDVSGYVVLNVQGTIDIGGNGITNGVAGTADIPPEAVMINSAGTTVNIHGNGAVCAILNAPNATVTLNGGGSGGYFVGAIQANNIVDKGGYPLHYDVQLAAHSGGMVSVPTTTAYSRKKM